jgi:hypothetical protein
MTKWRNILKEWLEKIQNATSLENLENLRVET